MPWQPVAAVIAALILLATFIRTVVIPVARLVKAAVHLSDMWQTIETEFRPNGGSSLVDRVRDIELTQVKMREHQVSRDVVWAERYDSLHAELKTLAANLEASLLKR